uniref:Uncharacterized protein n=1 Tax=Heterorhabditis bacteriophora TaxID=37862 RepID=A0A1I7WGC3_HETBA
MLTSCFERLHILQEKYFYSSLLLIYFSLNGSFIHFCFVRNFLNRGTICGVVGLFKAMSSIMY